MTVLRACRLRRGATPPFGREQCLGGTEPPLDKHVKRLKCARNARHWPSALADLQPITCRRRAEIARLRRASLGIALHEPCVGHVLWGWSPRHQSLWLPLQLERSHFRRGQCSLCVAATRRHATGVCSAPHTAAGTYRHTTCGTARQKSMESGGTGTTACSLTGAKMYAVATLPTVSTHAHQELVTECAAADQLACLHSQCTSCLKKASCIRPSTPSLGHIRQQTLTLSRSTSMTWSVQASAWRW